MFKRIFFPAIPSPSITNQQINDNPQQQQPCTETEIDTQGQRTQHDCGQFEGDTATRQTNMALTIGAPLVQQTSLQRALQDKEKKIYQTITGKHIQQWINTLQTGRMQITRDDFAKQHLLSPLEFKNYVTADGSLKLRAKILLNSGEGKPSPPIKCKKAIQVWQAMSPEERNHITREGFAEAHHLNPRTFAAYITAAGQLTARGKILFTEQKNFQYQRVNWTHVQAWQAMSQEERERLTRDGFAEAHHLNLRTFVAYVTTTGQLTVVGKMLLNKQQGVRYQKINGTHIQAWQAMSQEERECLTHAGFAEKHHLHPLSFATCVTKTGRLTDQGKMLLNKQQGVRYQKINETHIQAWQAMSQEERERLTRDGFAEAHHLNLRTFVAYVTTTGQLTVVGKMLLNKQQGVRYQKINGTHLQAWQAMSQEDRVRLTREGFAEKYHLHPLSFATYATKTGRLTARGQKILLNRQKGSQYQRVNETHVQAWQAMSQEEREYLTRAGFAKKYHLDPLSFAIYVTKKGQLTARGQTLAKAQKGILYQKIKWEDIEIWKNMLPNERKFMTLRKFAEQRQLSFNTLSRYVHANGTLTKNGLLIHALNQQTTRASIKTQASTAEEDAGDLKLFPAPGHPVEVQAMTHQINNNAPILQHHLTGETLTGEADHLRTSSTSWVALRPFLSTYNQSEQREIKHHILQQAKDWVRTEGHHQQRFDEMLEVAINLDETTPRGTSVFAKKAIPAFTVIGPYSGTLLPDQEALEQLTKQYGHNNIQTYLYQAGPATGPYRDRTISAFRSGNVLSLINDAELSEPILDRNGQVIKNNLAAIRIDNKIFLVSVSDIVPEQELFLDYGEEYQVHFRKQLAVHQKIASIKQEGL